MIPGAAVTATSGSAKLTTSTDEQGRYALELPEGKWSITVETYGLQSSTREVEQGSTPTTVDWPLQFAQFARAAAPPAAPAQQARNQPARNQQAFQDVQLAAIANPPTVTEPANPTETAAPTDSFLVNGSLSQGLQNPQQPDSMFMGFGPQGGVGPGGAGGNPFGGPEGQNPFGDGGPGGGPGGGRGGGFGGMGGGPGGGRGGGFGGMGGGPGGMRGGPGGPGGFRNLTPEQRAALMERMRNMNPQARNFGNRRRSAQPALRGMATYQVGNSAFDAAPYSFSGQDVGKPAYGTNRFGVMLGGPLKIRRLIDLKQTFFIVNYNGTRNRNTYSAFSNLPTEMERAGNFSLSPTVIYDPRTRQPFPGNIIPTSRLDPIALGLLPYVPLPNRASIQNYQVLTSVPRNSDTLMVRINQGLNAKHRLLGGFNWQRRDNESVALYGFRDESSGGNKTVDFGWMWTISAGKIHNLRFRFSDDHSDLLPFFAFGPNVAGNLGIAGPSDNPTNYGPPNLSFTNYGDLGAGSYTLRRNRSWAITDSFNLIRGTHTFTFGAEYRLLHADSNSDVDARGSFTFSGIATSAYDANGLPIRGTGYDFADFLLGFPQSSSIRYSSTNTYLRSSVVNAWIQDEWRVRSNLSINVGLRYEFFQPYSEKFNHIANLDVAPGFTAAAVVLPDQAGPYSGVFPRALVQSDPNNLSPRIGFAWRPMPSKRLQLRGGYSIFYDGSAYRNIANRLAAQPPFASTATLTTGLDRTLTLEDGFGVDPTKTITNTFAVARDYRVAYAQTWSFAVQQELPHSIVVEGAYVGTKGTGLDILRQPNRADPGSPLTAEERRQISDAVGFTFNTAEGNSIFHAAQLRVSRRLRRGLMVNALYTFSKSIDNASSIGGVGNVVAQNDRDLSAERGLSIFDQRHSLTFMSMISSPFGEGGVWFRDRSLASTLLKQWNLTVNVTARSGNPLTARVLGNQADTAGTGSVGSGRADATGQPITAGEGFFNTNAFTIPAPGTFGNAGRDTIPGPAFITLGASFGRSFQLSERRRLEFRISSDNLLNQVNYTGLSTVVNSLTYGQPLAVGAMRTVTASLRLQF
jgi:hypothetical protein